MPGRVREWIEWFGLGRLVVTALSVLAVGAGGYWLVRPAPTPVESSLPRATSGSQNSGAPSAASASAGSVDLPFASTSSEAPATILVHVAGAVVSPGVYSLAGTSRVIDAVTAAGGPTGEARPDAINLASPLHDGDRVYLPTVAESPAVAAGVSSATPAAGSGPSGPINLNTATADQLDALPGVGPSTAAAIVAHREAHGPFASVDGLDEVRGIGPAKLESLRPLVTV
ncbi:MAG: putative competence protein ComEA [Actinomycetota bacterium]|jgi:competence protein ComEA